MTIDDLVDGMGVGRPTLCSVFGDKRTLFLRVLKTYAEKKGARAAKALLAPEALRATLASFFRFIVAGGVRLPQVQERLQLSWVLAFEADPAPVAKPKSFSATTQQH